MIDLVGKAVIAIVIIYVANLSAFMLLIAIALNTTTKKRWCSR